MKGFAIIIEIVVIVAIIAVIALVAVFANQILTDLDTSLTAAGENTTMLQGSKAAVLSMDELVLFLLGGLFIAGILSAFALREHPAFAIFSMILLFIIAPLIAMFANVWDAMAVGDTATSMASFTTTDLLMQNLPAICFIFGGIIIIVMFSRTSTSGGFQ